MVEAALPGGEATRLAAIEELGILYSPAEERFDRITRLARRVFDVPIALVSIVAANCQWFKSRQGLGAAETPRSVAFCAHAILLDGPFVVEDTLLDARFADNPLVTGEPYIRFYAGVPISDAAGNKLGTLCVIDRRPRPMSEADREQLSDLARWVESELRVSQLDDRATRYESELDETRRQARIDPLTQTWNRRAFGEILEREVSRSRRSGRELCMLMLDIDRFKSINDAYGHQAGDEALREVARRVRGAIRAEDALCRLGGEEFAVILADADRAGAWSCAEKIRARIADRPVEAEGREIPVTASLGVASLAPGAGADELVAAADAALYRAKRAGRNRVEA